jgi:hypothetical protein
VIASAAMAKGEAGRGAARTGGRARGAVLALFAAGSVAGLPGCDDKLPGFADPPQYEPEDASDGDAAADDDAG